jgi:hypothetical protein
MKKIRFLVVLGCLFPWMMQAQGNLQFNQVIVLSGAQTVPAGKVWKLESLIMPSPSFIKYQTQDGGSCGCNASSSYSKTRYITDYVASFFAGKNNIKINGEEISYQNTIIWLNAGSTVEPIVLTTPPQQPTPASGNCYSPYWIDNAYVGCGPYTPPQVSVTPKISIIEFNVTP